MCTNPSCSQLVMLDYLVNVVYWSDTSLSKTWPYCMNLSHQIPPTVAELLRNEGLDITGRPFQSSRPKLNIADTTEGKDKSRWGFCSLALHLYLA